MKCKTLTIEECITRYETEQIAVVIEDGAVVGFVEEQKKAHARGRNSQQGSNPTNSQYRGYADKIT